MAPFQCFPGGVSISWAAYVLHATCVDRAESEYGQPYCKLPSHMCAALLVLFDKLLASKGKLCTTQTL